MSKGDKGRVSSEKREKGIKSSSRGSVVKMTKERAQAIQAHADKFRTNQEFKSRVMRASDINENEG